MLICILKCLCSMWFQRVSLLRTDQCFFWCSMHICITSAINSQVCSKVQKYTEVTQSKWRAALIVKQTMVCSRNTHPHTSKVARKHRGETECLLHVYFMDVPSSLLLHSLYLTSIVQVFYLGAVVTHFIVIFFLLKAISSYRNIFLIRLF